MDNQDYQQFLSEQLETDTSLTELEKCELADEIATLEESAKVAEYQAMLDVSNDAEYKEYSALMANDEIVKSGNCEYCGILTTEMFDVDYYSCSNRSLCAERVLLEQNFEMEEQLA
jgi:hypothetical protein